jgi:hypothetical protein
MKKEVISKEVMNVCKALEKYSNKHKGNVVVSASLIAFDKAGEVIDDRIIQYGDQEILIIALEDMLKDVKEEYKKEKIRKKK